MCSGGGGRSSTTVVKQPAPAASAVPAANVQEVVQPVMGTTDEDEVVRRAQGKRALRVQLGSQTVGGTTASGLAIK